MNNEEHDKLWALLGKAREPKVSPFFVSKVIRAVREAGEPQPGLLAWLRRRWMVPVAAGACAVLVVAFALHPRPVAVEKLASGSDLLEEIVAISGANPETPSLDSLLASEDHSIWLETDPSSLY